MSKVIDKIKIANHAEDYQVNAAQLEGNTLTEVLQLVYPVGAVYISTVNTNPATLFGFGTWTQIQDRFLLAAGSTYSAGKTGGSATQKLTAAQLPSVTGEISFHGKYTGNMVSGAKGAFSPKAVITGKYAIGTSSSSSTNSIEVVAFDNGGEGAAHNNMPPYLAVYIWKRTE